MFISIVHETSPLLLYYRERAGAVHCQLTLTMVPPFSSPFHSIVFFTPPFSQLFPPLRNLRKSHLATFATPPSPLFPPLRRRPDSFVETRNPWQKRRLPRGTLKKITSFFSCYVFLVISRRVKETAASNVAKTNKTIPCYEAIRLMVPRFCVLSNKK